MPSASGLLDTSGMETASERRKRKLIELCGKHGLRTVADRAGVNQFALEQVMKGVLLPAKKDGTRSPRNLGDAAARAIERAFDKPEGWFDSHDVGGDERSLSDAARRFGAWFDFQATQEQRELIMRMLPVDMGEGATLRDLGSFSDFGHLLDLHDEPKKKDRQK